MSKVLGLILFCILALVLSSASLAEGRVANEEVVASAVYDHRDVSAVVPKMEGHAVVYQELVDIVKINRLQNDVEQPVYLFNRIFYPLDKMMEYLKGVSSGAGFLSQAVVMSIARNDYFQNDIFFQSYKKKVPSSALAKYDSYEDLIRAIKSVASSKKIAGGYTMLTITDKKQLDGLFSLPSLSSGFGLKWSPNYMIIIEKEGGLVVTFIGDSMRPESGYLERLDIAAIESVFPH